MFCTGILRPLQDMFCSLCLAQTNHQSLKSPMPPTLLPGRSLDSTLTEKTKDSNLTYLNFHFSPFKNSPPSLTFILFPTVCLLSKAYLFIFLAQLHSPGRCSITRSFIWILTLFLSMRFFSNACKHEVISNTGKKKCRSYPFKLMALDLFSLFK